MPYGTGHIHDTFLSRVEANGSSRQYIVQRINHHVFPRPALVMENIECVTRFARERIARDGGDPLRETLTIIPTHDGHSFLETAGGQFWRVYAFIDGAHTYDEIQDIQMLVTVARAFGGFSALLRDLPGDRLHETIPGFHDTPRRFRAFLTALERDPLNRADGAREEIAFVMRREPDIPPVTRLLAEGRLPLRVTHNDTKINNVLIADDTRMGLCVIDLDTVMPGTILYDFGDLVRMGASTAAEDEPELNRVSFNLEKYEALVVGYLEATRAWLTPLELEWFPFAAKLITLECGMRFLTDYLNGDVYFKVHHDGHNLERCRTQFKLVAEMETRLEAMHAIVGKHRDS